MRINYSENVQKAVLQSIDLKSKVMIHLSTIRNQFSKIMKSNLFLTQLKLSLKPGKEAFSSV
jgi:hypothetical protein